MTVRKNTIVVIEAIHSSKETPILLLLILPPSPSIIIIKNYETRIAEDFFLELQYEH